MLVENTIINPFSFLNIIRNQSFYNSDMMIDLIGIRVFAGIFNLIQGPGLIKSHVYLRFYDLRVKII